MAIVNSSSINLVGFEHLLVGKCQFRTYLVSQ